MSTFVVYNTGSGRRDTYGNSEFFWTIEHGGTLVVHRRGRNEKVAAYAPNWWYRVETEDDNG